MTDAPRPSLAELRVWATKQMPVQCEFPQDAAGTRLALAAKQVRA